MGLAVAFTCQGIPGRLCMSYLGRFLKEVLPGTCFADESSSLLQEPQNLKIEVRTTNWGESVKIMSTAFF